MQRRHTFEPNPSVEPMGVLLGEVPGHGDVQRRHVRYGKHTHWFERVLKTVDLRPEDALDALSPSEFSVGGAERIGEF